MLPELFLLSMSVPKTVVELPHDLLLHFIILFFLLYGILIKLDFYFIFHSVDMFLYFEAHVLYSRKALIS